METYEAIFNRRTMRDFSEKEIDSDLIRKIISAGFAAPTNDHLRNWHFILLQDKNRRLEMLRQVIHPVSKKGAIGIINRWQMKDPTQRAMYTDAIPKQLEMLLTAGLLLIPCFKINAPLLKPKILPDLNSFASIWCCIENMLVAASAEGIYGVTRIPWETERKYIKEFLKVPADYEVPCYLALGYPAENGVRARQVEIDLTERIHLETWEQER